MLYLFTMVVAPARTLSFYLFCTITHAFVSMQYANISRIPVQQWTCTLLVRWMHSHPAAEKFNYLVPSPSETWLWSMSVGGSFRRVEDRAHPREMQPTGCLRDLACRLRRGGSMVGWGWCFQVCASSELQFGGLREGGGTREAGNTVAESLVVLYQVGTHWIRRRRRAARPLTSQGMAETLCARIESANREGSEGKADLWPRSFFFLREPHGAASGQDSWDFFKDAQGFGRLDAGSRAGFASSRPPPPPWTSVFQFSLFLYDVWPWETWVCWSKLVGTYLSDLLLRTLVVGRRQ